MMAKELAYGKFFRTHPLEHLPWLFMHNVVIMF
jgi:hypothetical protein